MGRIVRTGFAVTLFERAPLRFDIAPDIPASCRHLSAQQYSPSLSAQSVRYCTLLSLPPSQRPALILTSLEARPAVVNITFTLPCSVPPPSLRTDIDERIDVARHGTGGFARLHVKRPLELIVSEQIVQ